MKRHSGDQTGAVCGVAWQLQNGRSRIQRGMVADGFRGEYPYAGVVVVAENRVTEDDSSASIAVETVRDVFAEGVAFGVEDALIDSLIEAAESIKDKKLSGCSVAAIAFSGTHVWYASAGNCRIYRIDSDGIECIVLDQSSASDTVMSSDHADYSKKVKELRWWLGSSLPGKPVTGHSRIRRDTTYLVLTSGSWIQFENSAFAVHTKSIKKTLAGWLSSLSRDLKLAYRRQGGALGAVSGMKSEGGSSVSWRSWSFVAVVLGLIGFLVFANPFSSRSGDEEKTDLFSPESAEQIVQPILEDTLLLAADSAGLSGMFTTIADSLATEIPDCEDITSELPLQVVQAGGEVSLLNPDSFAVSLNAEPDLQWENFTSGIYAVRGDTASTVLAQAISSSYPELEIVEVDRIVTVRENGVAESARWLASLSKESAEGTVVVVETTSSVAGGAEWIRKYPVFINGNREDRAGEAGGFVGDSLPGLPSLRNPRCYRMVVVL